MHAHISAFIFFYTLENTRSFNERATLFKQGRCYIIISEVILILLCVNINQTIDLELPLSYPLAVQIHFIKLSGSSHMNV